MCPAPERGVASFDERQKQREWSLGLIVKSINVDRGDPTDLNEQVAGEICRAIAEGEAKPEEFLPLAKDLAAADQQ